MRLLESNPNLFRLIERCLTEDFVSAAAGPADERLRAGMLRSLATLEVGKRCRCADAFCQTFEAANVAPSAAGYHVMRFVVHGELLVECDDDVVISKVERLFQESPSTARCFTPTPEGWVERTAPCEGS